MAARTFVFSDVWMLSPPTVRAVGGVETGLVLTGTGPVRHRERRPPPRPHLRGPSRHPGPGPHSGTWEGAQGSVWADSTRPFMRR